MKKIVIIIINMIIIAAILTFVVLYSKAESRESYKQQIEHFENTTVTMEQVTENYLESEQRICDVWARYINSKTMYFVMSIKPPKYKTPSSGAKKESWAYTTHEYNKYTCVFRKNLIE